MTSSSPKKRSVEKWRFLANLEPRRGTLRAAAARGIYRVADDAARGRIAKY